MKNAIQMSEWAGFVMIDRHCLFLDDLSPLLKNHISCAIMPLGCSVTLCPLEGVLSSMNFAAQLLVSNDSSQFYKLNSY